MVDDKDTARVGGFRLWRWFDQRIGASKFARTALNKIFPDHWSFMLGEIAMYSLIVLVVTGVYLTFFFTPSGHQVIYDGSYAPLHGVPMSEAYESTIRISFDVRAGLVIRQMHHWAALIFAGAVVVHLLRIFFTGAFRRPREINWIIGLTMFILVMVNGFSGYSMPDDLLSGTGLRIAYSIALAIPVIGGWVASLVFGGDFPSQAIISRLFISHVLIVPVAIAALLGAHLAILWRQKHTQFAGVGRTEHNIVGSKLWPTYTARSIGLLAAVGALLAFFGGLFQINPIWLYGPYDPSSVSTAAQPDWYMGWLEGSLRIFPPTRFEIFGYTVSELLLPAVIVPGAAFTLIYLWPFIEARVTGDHRDHELLDNPRDRPVRTAIGVGGLAFFIVLFLAGSQDILAQKLSVSIPVVTNTFRVLVLVAPIVSGLIAWRVCHQMKGAHELEHRKAAIRDSIGAELELPSGDLGSPTDGSHFTGSDSGPKSDPVEISSDPA
ncbi:MAG TPA: cytochrome bc complex cytochrome b subunit [Microthrixaceae bacterium]|nr:cytochrome bc complex cytochrome b subunit [Microthrixaceae bacterium]